MKNFMMCQFVHHETFVCHEPSELESSTSLPGGNLVDGLPLAFRGSKNNSGRIVFLGSLGFFAMARESQSK